ncbi:ATP-dependent carboxylate-amine ligase [Alphaproteobacteria bacterium KMM 3653]|uniref:ATP-dependent carboxylate-amine ligase n=1 Tax=Harenicola maris TaxID=2841044 RepID=A0AAP2G5U5_9RHOB|nr:ATP-dependent carboxylate-amine ligase [Harenicola maris]
MLELETLRDENLHLRRPFLRLLFEAAAELGGSVEVETRFGHLGQYVDAEGTRRPIFGTALSLNSDAAAAIAADKDYTARLLQRHGLPAPDGQLIVSPAFRKSLGLKDARAATRLPDTQSALRFAASVGFPVYTKPNKGSEGAGISRAETKAELTADIKHLLKTHSHARVEQAIPGRDYRVLVLDGEVALAYERLPFTVTGDGTTPLSGLLAEALQGLSRERRGCKLSADDPRIARHLAAQGLTPQDTPAKGAAIPLLPSANVSTGGTIRDVTRQLPPEVHSLAHAAAASIGLTLAGVDILSPDLESGTEGAVILEVNSAPGLDGYASAGPREWDHARQIVIKMLDR